jgi:energy-coupling factor transporter ATP-binding protein EcfA2
MNDIVTAIVDETFDVRRHLARMRVWQDEWFCEDAQLRARLRQLKTNKPLDKQLGKQIGLLRKRLKMRRVREPLEIAKKSIETEEGYRLLRKSLAKQFAALSKEDRLLWLNNFLFIMTPDLWKLHEKVKKILGYYSIGQQRNLLLGGHSGMGKSTYLNLLSALNIPVVEALRNLVSVIKVDAPVSNVTPKTLLRRMILECGMTYLKGNDEEDLLMQLDLYFQQCDTELLIVDEIEHISRPEMRRRLLDISNMTQGIPIICASCNPTNWTIGDVEVAGRWNDYFELPQYLGERLSDLLTFIEILLPFTQESNLALREVKSGTDMIDGPAKLIQEWTGGILRDIMILIRDASQRAIEQDLPCLSPKLLEETWKGIQEKRVTDFSQEANEREDDE